MYHRLARLASPAPWKTKVWFNSLSFVILRAANIPATATDAVPAEKITLIMKQYLLVTHYISEVSNKTSQTKHYPSTSLYFV